MMELVNREGRSFVYIAKYIDLYMVLKYTPRESKEIWGEWYVLQGTNWYFVGNDAESIGLHGASDFWKTDKDGNVYAISVEEKAYDVLNSL